MIVVEGKDDIVNLWCFYNVDIYEIRGLVIDEEDLECIECLYNLWGVIVFIDLDYNGECICKIIMNVILIVCYVFFNWDEVKLGLKIKGWFLGVEYVSFEDL